MFTINIINNNMRMMSFLIFVIFYNYRNINLRLFFFPRHFLFPRCFVFNCFSRIRTSFAFTNTS